MMALFGMKLHSEYVLMIHGAGKIVAILRFGKYVCFVSTVKVIGMKEIESRVFLQLVKQGGFLNRRHVVPPHMRQMRTIRQGGCIKLFNRAVDPAKTWQRTFLA